MCAIVEEGHSLREAARRCGLPNGTAQKWRHRGKTQKHGLTRHFREATDAAIERAYENMLARIREAATTGGEVMERVVTRDPKQIGADGKPVITSIRETIRKTGKDWRAAAEWIKICRPPQQRIEHTGTIDAPPERTVLVISPPRPDQREDQNERLH